MTLTKKGPLKITTEAQKKLDPSQTRVKTVYDPTKEKEPLQGSKSIKGKTAYIERENLKTQELSPKRHPMVGEIKASLKVGVQFGKLDQVVLMEMGDQIKVENHQEKGKDHQMGLEK